MLWNVRTLKHMPLEAEDGEIGRCRDFLFDDRFWTVRFMVADTRKWLPGRKVLLSPIAVKRLFPDPDRLALRMTRRQVEESPPLEEDAPVSRGYELAWFRHHGWPPYWNGPHLWGGAPYPYLLYDKRERRAADKTIGTEEIHLWSVNEMIGYEVRAKDGEIGSVYDFIMDERTWTIRYVVADAGKWFQVRDHKVILIPDCVTSVESGRDRIVVDLTRKAVKDCPEYSSETPLNRDLEVVFHDYYGWPRYWEEMGE